MVDKLFTDSLEKARESLLNDYIKNDIKLLRKYFKGQDVNVLQAAKPEGLFITFNLKINIPSRGTVNDIPIGPEEPIILLINKNTYPHKAPSAFSNRIDFPSTKLPHLNPVPKGAPAYFCLHRGNIDDWFAEHTIIDFVGRIEAWLNDAAANKLIREVDEFEVTRISKSGGYLIFDESETLSYLNYKYKIDNKQAGFGYVNYELLKDTKEDPLIKKETYAVKHCGFFKSDKLAEARDSVRESNKIADDKHEIRKELIGVFCYPEKDKVYNEYFSEIPNKLGQFLSWTDSLEVPVRQALQDYLKNDLQFFGGIPLSIIVARPTKVIRHSSNIEILNFVIWAGGTYSPKDGKFDDDTDVELMEQKHPVTIEYARDLSAFQKEGSMGGIFQVGCGALGSKIALHFIRSGQVDFTFLDNDDLSPHNIIRHGLLSNSLGLNKAEALKKEIDKMYDTDTNIKVEIIKESVIDHFSSHDSASFLKPYNIFIDASASNGVFNFINRLEFPTHLKYFRTDIVNSGNFGILFSEGKDRNPRMDDLQVAIYDMSIERDDISKWLQDNRKEQGSVRSTNEEIMVGMSCSSDTIKLSDELISLHASVASTAIRKLSQREEGKGIIQLSKYSPDNLENIFNVQQHKVNPFDVIKMRNDSEWVVRMKSGLKEEMFCALRKDFPNETGGLLLGRLNPKTKVVHITRILPAPPDSKKLPYLFIRGKVGVPLAIRKHRSRSGGLIDFVGEWHTHPNGSAQMSSTDQDAVNELRKYLDPIPYPTLILIITPNKVCPYIYGPK